ncbi:DUF6286 domain-containing protein [Frondihabitans peucedani]|uniref:DUF6286 domain-containing protein n=1 Tax=Frondihabitans peucedani TaxID=598626 RepID=A0ABP8E226_9MICO
MTSTALYRRLVRRETHSSRSGIAIVLAVVLMLVLAWIGTEAVLSALKQPALLVAPKDAAVTVLQAAGAPVGLLAAGGVVVAIVGLILIIVSLAPGRRGRRGVAADRTAAVVDDRVIAQSVAQKASYAGDVDPDQVHVSVGTRAVAVEVSRTSGRSADLRSIQAAVDEELSSYDFQPSLRGKVHLSKKGTIS